MINKYLSQNYLLGIVFLGAVALAVILVPLSGQLARALGVVDHPDGRKIHRESMTRMGGLAMALSLAVVLILGLGMQDSTVRAFLLGGGFVVFTGLMDDTQGLSHRMKFLGEILAAVAFLLAGGFYLQSFGNLLGFGEITTGPVWLGTIITVFCMVGVMNAINLADGLDGLAAGVCIIVALFMAFVSYENHAVVWTVICLALIGVMLGFLRHNHYPAKLFMGDTGSLLLGYSMAAIAVGLAQTDAPHGRIEPVMLGTLLALPIVDTLWVMFIRKLCGRHLFKADQEHFHHRLLRIGLRHNESVVVIYVIMFALGYLAWFGRGLPEWVRFFTVIVSLAILYAALHMIERLDVPLPTRINRLKRQTRRIVSRVFRHPAVSPKLDRQTLSWFFGITGMLLAVLMLLPAVIIPLPAYLGIALIGTALFVAFLYPWQGSRTRLLIGFGILYAACFMLFFFYMIAPDKSPWMLPLMYGTAALALLWLLGHKSVYPRRRILMSTGFEMLLFSASWLVPFIALPLAGADIFIQFHAAMACIFALIIVLLFKLLLRRRPLRNIAVAASIVTIYVLLGLIAVL